jgi:VanZ family protein
VGSMRVVAIVWLLLWAFYSLPFTSFTPTPQWRRVGAPHAGPLRHLKPDHVLNVLFYIPLAPIAVTVGCPLGAAVAGGTGLSLAAEASQLFSTERSPDGNDVIANVAGTLVGAAIVSARKRSRER